ncbi:hypothetical protein JST97_12180 [bacterium]|nr:hypothetical protein [bacterium]
MNVQSNHTQPAKFSLPKPVQAQKGPEAPEPTKGGEDSFAHTALDAAVTIGSSAVKNAFFYWGGGGSLGGTMTFTGAYYGTSGAIEGGQLVYGTIKQIEEEKGDKAPRSATIGLTTAGVLGGAALGAGFGALQGFATFTLTQAMGGGIPGALAAGAAVGLGQVVADRVFGK